MTERVLVRPGRSIGKYEIVKHLATGGMAEIYLARANTLPGLQKLVVLKRMLPELAVRDDYVQMFLDEARIATLLDHPNVVHTFDAGLVDGQPFLAMEYLRGEPVNAVMSTLAKRPERLTVEHALGIVIGVCAGLHYAHEKVDLDGRALNVVHRDVTPQNVILTYDGGVKLVDFGIAKSAQRAGRTRYGTIKGKVPYMSPEQCQGESLDRRSDIFSVGIMLYELTLNRRLFSGKGDYEVLKQIVEGRVVPPHELEPDYDPALEAVLMRALEKNPARRQQSARELQGELEAVARAAQLAVSSLALAQLMERCFGSKIQVLRQAEAQSDVQLLSLVVEQGFASEDLDALPPSVTAPAIGLVTRVVDAPTRVEPRRPPPPRHTPWLIAAGVVAALGAAAVYALVQPPQPALPPPAQVLSPPSPTTTPLPAAPGPVPVHRAPSRRAAAPRPAPAPLAPAPAPPPPSPAPAPEPTGTGVLVLATSPWCRVSVDGIDRGPTPLRLTLAAGKHVVDLANPDYHIARRIDVVVRANETLRKNLDFGD